jgi:hypothetical protein
MQAIEFEATTFQHTIRVPRFCSRRRLAAELIENPDQAILGSDKDANTSDSAILAGVVHWVNLGAYLITKYFHEAW